MDTFTPPFEPQAPATPAPLPTEAVPAVAPTPVAPPQPQPNLSVSTPATDTLSNVAKAPNNSWQMILILGLLLFLGGVGGYLYLWLM